MTRLRGIAPALDEALAADRPFVVDAVADPSVPPLPPHISFDQAASMARSLLGGDPNRGAVVRRSLRDLLAGLLHR